MWKTLKEYNNKNNNVTVMASTSVVLGMLLKVLVSGLEKLEIERCAETIQTIT